MKLIIASNNTGKIKEIKEILGNRFEEIKSLNEAGISHETVEDGKTFYENARKKAMEIHRLAPDSYCLADDSGLCVNALNGAPGVYSARFSGEHGNDEKNNALLLEKLQNCDDRTAFFECCMVLIAPDGKEYTASGRFSGEIAKKECGERGFGYDPLFFVPEKGKTVSQMTDDEKNKISHRAKALNNLLDIFS